MIKKIYMAIALCLPLAVAAELPALEPDEIDKTILDIERRANDSNQVRVVDYDQVSDRLTPFGPYRTDSIYMTAGASLTEASNPAVQSGVYYMIDRDSMHGLFGGRDEMDWIKSGNAWKVACKKDEIYSVVDCVISRKTIHILFSKESYIFINSGEDHSYQSNGVLKIDDHQPIEAKYFAALNGIAFKKAVGQMRVGKYAITRYSDYEGQYTDHVSLSGLSEAINYMEWYRSKLKRAR